jgi:hypothetical protein
MGQDGLASLIDPGWYDALAPVHDRIAAMGEFLRAELAAGRRFLPAGERVLAAFARPLADVRVLIVGQDHYGSPTPSGCRVDVAQAPRDGPHVGGDAERQAHGVTRGRVGSYWGLSEILRMASGRLLALLLFHGRSAQAAPLAALLVV